MNNASDTNTLDNTANQQGKLKWFHAIGACGKATAPITKMFKDMGWFVTGTDAQFSPPASDILVNNNIPFALDYHFSHMTKSFWEEKLKNEKWEEGNPKYWVPRNEENSDAVELNIPEKPDLSLIVESATNKNKEYMYAKVQGIDVRPFSQILGEYLVKPESVVVIGTAGKTTTTALIVHILKGLGLYPSFMVGADVVGFKDAVENTNSNISVLEGDEYHNKDLSNGAKFLEFKPKYLTITNIGWEHQEIFPTQDEYINEFRKVIQLIPADGLIVAKLEDRNIDKIVGNAKCRVIRYSVKNDKDSKSSEDQDQWSIEDQKEGKFTVFNANGDKVLTSQTELIGSYNLENIVSATIIVDDLLKQIGKQVNYSQIGELISTFKGVTKRLEKVFEDEILTIIDDFGIAPNRAKNSLGTLRNYYPEHKIIAVFEPNAGSRPNNEEIFKEIYQDAFKEASEVIIPELSEFNKELVGTDQFIQWLKELGFNVNHLKKEEIKEYLEKKVREGRDKNEKLLVIFFSAYRLTNTVHNLAGSMI